MAVELGATHALRVVDEPGDTLVRTVLRRGADHVFEVLGRPETVEAAWRAATAGGQSTVVGLLPAGARITLDAFALITGKRLVGTYFGGTELDRDIPALAAAAASDDITLAPLIEEITFDDLPAAVERLRAGEVTARLVVRAWSAITLAGWLVSYAGVDAGGRGGDGAQVRRVVAVPR